MMYEWWSSGAPWYGMFFGPIAMIAFIALAVLVVAWAVRALGAGWRSDGSERTPLDVLKDRFARGEIDQAEYEKRRQVLSRP